MAKDSAGSDVDASLTLTRRIRDAVLVLRTQAHAVRPEDWLAIQTELLIIRLEWNDTLEKINTWAARTAKRHQRALDDLASGEAEQTAPSAANGDLDGQPTYGEFIPGHQLPK